MKKLLVILLLTFSLTGCSNSVENDVKTEERTLQETGQDEIEDEDSVITAESEEIDNEIDLTTEDIIESEEPTSEDTIESEESTTEMYTTEQSVDEDSDYYAICTSYSKEEIESFAKTIKTLILNKEWEELADKVTYPITIGNIECSNEEDFKKIVFDDILTDDFYTALEEESCEEMFCNYAGIMLGDGQVWISEIIDEETGDRPLMVTTINP